MICGYCGLENCNCLSLYEELRKERDGARAALEDRDKMHAEYIESYKVVLARLIAERDDALAKLKQLTTDCNFMDDVVVCNPKTKASLEKLKTERDEYKAALSSIAITYVIGETMQCVAEEVLAKWKGEKT